MNVKRINNFVSNNINITHIYRQKRMMQWNKIFKSIIFKILREGINSANNNSQNNNHKQIIIQNKTQFTLINNKKERNKYKQTQSESTTKEAYLQQKKQSILQQEERSQSVARMIEEKENDVQLQKNTFVQRDIHSIPYLRDLQVKIQRDGCIIDEQQQRQEQEKKLEEEEKKKTVKQQFNRKTTLEDIENPFLTIDEKIQNAIIALKKPTHQRNLKEQKAIIRVIESNNFIQKTKAYNKNLLHQIANCVELEKIQKGKSVFQYGDRPDKFYLIVIGKVSVLVPKTKNEISQIKDEMENEQSCNSIDGISKKYKANDVRHNTLFLNFPDMKTKNKQNDQSSDRISPQQSMLDTSKYFDEVGSTLATKKKSNFSMINSERQIRINKDIQRISQGSNLQIGQKKSSHQTIRKKKIEDYQVQDEKLFSEIPLLRSEIFNWKQYFLVEDDVTIIKYNHIKFLSDGDVFGDFGLLIRKPRSASILAVQDTILLSIQKSDYEDLIREISYNKMEKKVKFFQQCLRFDESKIKSEYMNQIALDFSTKIKLNQGWNLFQEGDPTDCLYIIKKGELQLSKQVKFTFNETTKNYDYDINDEDFNQIYPASPTIRKGQVKQQQIDFVILSSYEFIGAEDLFYNKKYRSYTAKCLSDVTLYLIQKSQLLKLINEIFFFKIAMQKYAHTKYQHHRERVATVAKQRKLNLDQNQHSLNKQFISPASSSSQKDLLMMQNNSEKTQAIISRTTRKESLCCTNPYSLLDIVTANKKSSKQKIGTFSTKNILKSPQQHSKNQMNQTSQASFRCLTESQTFSQNNIYNNQIPSLQMIEEGTHKQQMNFHHLFEKKAMLTQPIANEKDETQSQYLSDLKSEFEGMNFMRPIQNNYEDNTEINCSSNPFWFDQNLKIQLDKKINNSIKEKDPDYIKKVRQTFKGNMESCKFGLLDKKLSKLIQSKPKLISTVINGLANNDNELLSPHHSKKLSGEIQQNKQLTKQRIYFTSSTAQNSSQKIQLPPNIQSENHIIQSNTHQQSQSLKKVITPKNSNLVNFYSLMEPNQISEDYQITNKLRGKAKEYSSLQLSPLRSIELLQKPNLFTPLALEPKSSIENQLSALPQINKKMRNSFNINHLGLLSERNIGKQEFNPLNKTETINNFFKKNKNDILQKTFYSPRESIANSNSVFKQSQNERNSSLKGSTEGSIFSVKSNKNQLKANNNNSKNQNLSVQSQKLIQYPNYPIHSSSNNNKKSCFEQNNIQQIS